MSENTNTKKCEKCGAVVSEEPVSQMIFTGCYLAGYPKRNHAYACVQCGLLHSMSGNLFIHQEDKKAAHWINGELVNKFLD